MLEETKTNAMENAVKLMTAQYAAKKEKCSFNGHAWLWASIILLILGQIASFVYLMHVQQNSVNHYSTLKCSCQESDDRLYVPPANFSIDETNLGVPVFAERDAEASTAFSRKRRSSSSKAGKSKKNATKVSKHKRKM